MSCFEDYEVLSILGTNLNSTCYKVKNKLTSEVFVWKAINYETYAEQSDGVLEKINKRRLQLHTCLLEFYDYILHEETRTVYLVTEYCKYGSIANIIQKCLRTHQYVHEDFLWMILYKLAGFYKCHQKQMEPANIYDTFVDVKADVKVLNFSLTESIANNCNLYDLGILLHQITHLSPCYQPNADFPEYYSNDLHNLLKFLTNPEPDVTPTIDAILCHPTVLLKQRQDRNYPIFVENPKGDQNKHIIEQNDTNESYERLYQVKLENLRKRESQLKITEQKLQERERNLEKKEKKIALMERIVKEKTSRAELYLKRARDLKPSVKAMKPSSYEKNDTSFSADCGESTIMPTSRKMDVKEIPKPTKFTRTMSERRVRFKSHSPLKEIHNIKRDFAKPLQPSIRNKRLPDLPEVTMNMKKLELDSDKTSEASDKCVPSAPKAKKKFALSSMFTNKRTKKPNSIASSSDSVSAHTYEDLDKGWDDFRHDLQDCRPINWSENTQTAQNYEPPQWTGDSKKQAFDLLRLMNQEEVDEIKHTFL
ncbi:serine/threonine-protein kinase Nek2-like [Atheta coriaria]|uniref:serine/threonine-protein kinase Nek2-like n=1 Tax=Dalotia coriaria TaxID=877792 RepID=UPI0031F39E0A